MPSCPLQTLAVEGSARPVMDAPCSDKRGCNTSLLPSLVSMAADTSASRTERTSRWDFGWVPPWVYGTVSLQHLQPIFRLFGKPEPYTYITVSRISQPASSIATASRWNVRVPPNASRCAPGFATRSAALQNATPGTPWSQSLPMKLSPYGGSHTTASTLATGSPAITVRQSPCSRSTTAT